MPPSISVIIPAHNGADSLRSCLAALRKCDALEYGALEYGFLEYIVVDDHSSEPVAVVAREFGAKVIPTDRQRGPAYARNLGASAAQGEILLFLDADVCVRPETLARIAAQFAKDETLDALFGCYDGNTSAAGFISQYKDLQHSFVHQQGQPEASTFWSGCGAVRKSVFLALGGFDASFTRPAIEDIELGWRMVHAGRRIRLDRDLQVKHLKQWTFWGLLKNDLLCRGIPWAELILQSRFLPNDLNLQLSQRLSVLLVALSLALLPAAPVAGSASLLGSVLLLASALLLNFKFYRFVAQRRGGWFAAAAVPVHYLYYLNCGVAFLCGAVHCAWKARGVARATQPGPTSPLQINADPIA